MSGQLQHGLRAAQHEAQQQSALFTHDIKELGRMAEKGFAATPDQIAGLQARVALSPDPKVREAMAVAEDTAKFQMAARSMPPHLIQGYADDLRAEMATKGVSPAGVARVEMAEKLSHEAAKQLKQDPLGWADRVGLAKIPPLELSEAGFGKSLEGRLVAAENVSQYYGRDAVYLRPEEKTRITRIAGQGGAAKIAGPERAHKIFAELFSDSPVVAAIGAQVAASGATAAARDAADGLAIQRAENGKKDGSFKARAPAAKMAAQLAVIENLGVYNNAPKADQAAIAMTNAAYEARARRDGIVEFDAALWRKTYREAALGERTINDKIYGGISYTRGLIGSEPVLIPPDVRRDGFRELLGTVTPADVPGARLKGGEPITAEQLSAARLVQVGGTGRYLLNLGSVDQPRFVQGVGRENYVLDLQALAPELRKRRPDLYLGGH
jgi:hypothetical protein